MKRLRLLLDQMIDASVAQSIREAGHDVVRTADVGMAREDDAGILRKAGEEDRILITLDRHFGDWVVLPLSRHSGVVRVKADPATSDEVMGVFLPFLMEHSDRDFRNYLVIVRKTGVRWIKTAVED